MSDYDSLSVTLADYANTATTLVDEYQEPINIGTNTTPVYIVDGIPATCTSVAAYSATILATSRTIYLSGDATGSVSFNGASNVTIYTSVNRSDYAEGAHRLVEEGNSRTTYVGNDSTPVYIEDGVPIECGSVEAYSATRLAVARTITLSGNTTGSASFSGASNVTINTTTSYATTAGSAETAESATTADSATVADSLSVGTVGSASQPVYFSNGAPAVASSVPRLYLHSTMLTDSTSAYPQYRILWLSTSSSAVDYFVNIKLNAIVGGVYLVSSVIAYYGLQLQCYQSSSTSYTFYWIRWDASTTAMIQTHSETVSYTSNLGVSDTVISL